MPDITFSITGTGSTQFVLDWALQWGYKEEIPDPEHLLTFVQKINGQQQEMIPNPQEPTQFLIEKMFTMGKQAVMTKRKKEALAEPMAEIVSNINSINLEM